MNKFLINVAALLIPKKKNRHHFREKYKNLDLFTLLYSRHSKVIGQTDKKINDNQTRINFNIFLNSIPQHITTHFIKINNNKESNTNEPIDIFFANNNNVNALSVAIISILYHTNSFCNFYILESDVTDYAKQRLEFLKYQFSNFKIEWINVEPEKIFAGLSVDTANGTKHSWNGYYDIWTRFLIPEIKSDINKALYLDYDIIAMSDIKELWEQDLENFELGGVADFCNLNRKDIDCSEKHIYFGSGILLMDTQKMRETNFFERILKVVKEYNPKLIYPDQDALNIYYANGNYKLLEYRFGYLQNSKKRIKQGVSLKGVEDYYTKTDKIVIKHFNGQKPWNIIEAENSNEWWYYAKISPFFMDIVENFMKKGCNFRMF